VTTNSAERTKLRQKAKELADKAELFRRAADDYFVAGRWPEAKEYYEKAKAADAACNLVCSLIAKIRIE
jgi:hypothetical protein